KILIENYNIALNRFLEKYLSRYRFLLILIFQLFTIISALTLAFLIRFDFSFPPEYYLIFLKALPLLIVSRITAYFYYKIHSSSWRFVSIKDLMDTIKAVLLGSILFLVLMVFIYRLQDFPRSIFISESILSLMFIGGSRFIVRYYCEAKNKVNPKSIKYALIAGAGKAAFLLLNEIRTNPGLGIRVVGFVDDNPYKKGTNIQGIPVLGNSNDIPELAKKYNIDEVIIAIPSAPYKDVVRIKNIALSANLNTKLLPSIGKLVKEEKITGQLKEVSCDDLLGRRTLKFCRETDRRLLEDELKGKRVLVTGAGGSIGSELCRQIIQFNPALLVLYERYENTLYELELELRKEFPEQRLLPVIGDINDTEKFRKVLRENRIELIYHAAAYKHVPMMEREPIEAVRNNIIGTMNIAKLAIENNVNKFVFISTDKAVNPSNIMGTTKRVAELIVQGLNNNGTKFIAVRFGNVIGSNGSVIPLFKKQIAEGGPVTVTHPEVSRYFMAISEAVQLVMTAGAMGNGGEIFLLDMGKPIKIVELAEELIRKHGLEPGKDIDIVFTGLRPGEKLHEELYWQGEGIIPTENKKITMLRQDGICYDNLFNKIELLKECTTKGDVKDIIRLLKEIVPESTIRDVS
ncbi:MAG: nucleoside-diphosphate sugar epimerase/dehydratase, partial [candidate division WOR-3 bacterium]